MDKFIFGFEWFIYGFVAGFVANPLWAAVHKIFNEAKYAKDNWHPKDH